SALELAEDLRRFLEHEPITARPLSPAARAVRWCRRKPARAALIASLVLLVGVALPAWLWDQYRLARSAEEIAIAQKLATAAQRAQAEADKAKEAAQEIARLQEYFSLVNNARERISNRRPGWTWDALEALQAAGTLATPSRNLLDLRNDAAACL